MRKLALLAVAAFAVTTTANAQIVTKYSGIQPNAHPASYTEDYFADEVATLTKGTIKVEVYHNAQLGDAVANVQSIRNGTIGFTTVSRPRTSIRSCRRWTCIRCRSFSRTSAFLVVPGAPQAAELAKPLEAEGHEDLAYIDSGARNFFTAKADSFASRPRR